ncbi:MAG: hypothetical protein IJP48_02685 [Synergistaceae bacterium]|nr:hypothetical protein [Synergistaceae bacterium]
MNNTIQTGNIILDMELSLLTEQELSDLAKYARYLRWSRSWADAPLTDEEEAGLKQGREDMKNGDFMTLSEL